MNESYKWPLILGGVLVAILFAYSLMTMQDRRSGFDRVSDAVHDLPEGVETASRQLESRTPGQKLGDAVKDAGDKIKENTNP